jgi:Arc/MetJ-type ribon-helix-helix transcriptional regulator
MKVKVTVSIDEALIAWVDQLVDEGRYDSRSAALEAASTELVRQDRDRAFERELVLLDPAEERAEADLGMADYAALVSESLS